MVPDRRFEHLLVLHVERRPRGRDSLLFGAKRPIAYGQG